MTECRRHQTDSSHRSCHQDGADTRTDALFDGLVQRATSLQVTFDIRYHDHPVLYADTEESDKPDPRRYRKVETGKQQSQNPPDRGIRHIQQDQSCITGIPEEDEKDDKDNRDTDRYDLCQPFCGPLLVLEIACPFQRITLRQTHPLLHLLLRFGDSRPHIPSADGKLDGTEAGMIIAVDNQRSRNRADIRQFLDRDHRPVACRDQYLADLVFTPAERGFITDHDVELPFVLVKQRGALSPDRHLDDRLHVLFRHTVTCQAGFVQFDPQFRLSDIADHSQIFNPVHRLQDLIHLDRFLLRLVQVFAEHLHCDRTFHPAGCLLHVVADRLREVEVHPRIDIQPFLHLLDQFRFRQLALPLLLRIDIHMKLDVVETCRIRPIVRPSRL
ncbi:unknown [Parabacteroides johnsonii CAG:246]|nr:unknown [Parabacteroides johnsonii CAG:246]